MTEIAPMAGSSAHFGQKDGAVGRPLPFNEGGTCRRQNGNAHAGCRVTGEIRVRGPAAMCGCPDQPAETAQALRAGGIYTGDLSHLDADALPITAAGKPDRRTLADTGAQRL